MWSCSRRGIHILRINHCSIDRSESRIIRISRIAPKLPKISLNGCLHSIFDSHHPFSVQAQLLLLFYTFVGRQRRRKIGDGLKGLSSVEKYKRASGRVPGKRSRQPATRLCPPNHAMEYRLQMNSICFPNIEPAGRIWSTKGRC